MRYNKFNTVKFNQNYTQLQLRRGQPGEVEVEVEINFEY